MRVQSSRLETVPCVCGPDGKGDADADASKPFFSCASLTATRRRMPSQPSKSDFVLSTYWSIPPYWTRYMGHDVITTERRRTLRIVLRARVDTFTRTVSPRASE